MGYYTRYSIRRVDGDPGAAARLHDALAGTEIAGFSDGYPFIDKNPLRLACRCTWYDHETSILRAMVDSGATRVVLHGIGEENGDVWDKELTVIGGLAAVGEFRYRLVRLEEPLDVRSARIDPDGEYLKEFE